MNNLTPVEKKTFNRMSQIANPLVKLGDKIESIIGALGGQSEIVERSENSIPSGIGIVIGTPANAKFASAILAISGVSIHGDVIMIGDKDQTRFDVYEFLSDDAQTKSDLENIAINIVEKTNKARGILTVDVLPHVGDSFTIGDRTYVFVESVNSEGEILTGNTLEETHAAIIAAVNGSDGVNSPHPSVFMSEFVENSALINALIGGTIGNTIPTVSSFTLEVNRFSSDSLGSGTNCTAVNTVSALIEAINNFDTHGVLAEQGDGNTIIISAKSIGSAGNGIQIRESMNNASFINGATELNGGVDGTATEGPTLMMDDSYLYTCLNGNDEQGANWRRIPIGIAF